MKDSPPVDHFAALGLERRLSLSADAVRERFQELSRAVHPDTGGGSEEDYAALVAGAGVLGDRARRIVHWMALHGVAHDPRAVEPSRWVSETFGEVAELVKSASELVARSEAVTSALGRAVVDREKVMLADSAKELLDELRGRVAMLDERLVELDAGEEVDIDEISRLAVDGGFVQRWIDQLRSTVATLV